MANEGNSKRKCFTFIWKIKNASYCFPNKEDFIESPLFTVDEVNRTKWKMELYPSGNRSFMGIFLQRQDDENDEDAEIDLEITLLSLDGKVLHSWEGEKQSIEGDEYSGTLEFAERNDVFYEKRSVFLPWDTLTVRCRIWKSVGEMSKDVQCLARSRVTVEKRSFMWNIQQFSTFRTNETPYVIKSLSSGERLLSCNLSMKKRMIGDEIIYLKVIPNFQKMKYCIFQLSILDAFQNAVKCFQAEFWHESTYDNKELTLCYTKRELMEKKNIYLPNDELSLLCECTFSYGISVDETEVVSCDYIAVDKKKWNNGEDTETNLPVPTGILVDDFMSMLNDSNLYDIKLKTSSQSHSAHKCVLSARSPVFKAMFSSDMKEKINDSVVIEDLNDDTVSRMLRYIYSAEIGNLEWSSATDLYEASDKYQILSLKDICSFYLKDNLCVNNACEALILADLHQDKDLKAFIQRFILNHEEDIISSEHWNQLAKTNLKLAYETLLLKFVK